MKTNFEVPEVKTFSKASDKRLRVTQMLLAGGIVAGPLYLSASIIQGLTREGFDFTRHAVSLLSNGSSGWIQIINFIASGLLTIAGAAGMRRAMQSSRGRTWGPLLTGIYGLGLIGAGIFVADPMNGFPPGTPMEADTISWQGLMHFISGGVGFLALIAACFVFAFRYAALAKRGWAIYSAATGLIFFAAYAGIASGSDRAWIITGFWIGLSFAWAWISVMAARLITNLTGI